MKTSQASRPVGYVLKRYPRLSETFILNEIRALERAGQQLTIFSILRPEGTHVHSEVAEVRAPVAYFAASFFARLAWLVVAHATVALARPRDYLRAFGMAVRWQLFSRHRLVTWKHFIRAGGVARWCRSENVRHLHAHFVNGPATVTQLAATMCGIRHSFTAHAKDLYLSRPESVRHRMNGATAAVTCTQYNAAYIATALSDDDRPKIHTVYHGVDVRAFPFRQPSNRDASPNVPPVVLSVGRLVEKKGFGVLLEACRMLARDGVAFRCEIVGGGPLLGELAYTIARDGLENLVVLHGPMSHDRLVRIYARATLFALAPRIMPDGDRDGIPNVLVEAMAAGVPVVATSISGIPELIDSGRNGWLVAENDAPELANAIHRLLADADMRDSLARAARADVEKRFDCWNNARELQGIFAFGEALAQPRTAAAIP